MAQNINSDGSPTTKAILESKKNDNGGIYNLVAWINQDAYESSGGKNWNDGKDHNTFGPITAINFLSEATKNWTNINEMVINSFDNNDGTVAPKSMKTYNTYARMPYYNELGNSNGTNEYLYENLAGSNWQGIEGKQPTNTINGICGYWTLSAYSNDPKFAWRVSYYGIVNSNVQVINTTNCGVRPVINLKI